MSLLSKMLLDSSDNGWSPYLAYLLCDKDLERVRNILEGKYEVEYYFEEDGKPMYFKIVDQFESRIINLPPRPVHLATYRFIVMDLSGNNVAHFVR